MSRPQAILVLPHLRVQNVNAISSPLTHGFPSITAFTGLMWALERKLAQAGVPLHLQGVGVICHRHQEQVTNGYVSTFNLTRNPVDKDGSTAAIVEEGRMHLEITLVFTVSEKRAADAPPQLVQGANATWEPWARIVGETLSQMRIAGGSVLPTRPTPGKRVRPWLALLADDTSERSRQFREWRRQWLPGFALVGRDDLLSDRLKHLQTTQPDATVLDAWLHASRFNYEPVAREPDVNTPSPTTDAKVEAKQSAKVEWSDPLRPQGSGWTVPIPVGYAALTPGYASGTVQNARDANTPLRFVESVYSLGEWIGPHRLMQLEHLLWHAETDEELGLYRCRSGYQAPKDSDAVDALDENEDEESTYDYDL